MIFKLDALVHLCVQCAHLEVSNPVSDILVAGGLLIGQFNSFADCTQERLATHSEVSRTIDNHLQTLNLKE